MLQNGNDAGLQPEPTPTSHFIDRVGVLLRVEASSI
jgi:hypothetical protein